MKRPKRLRYSDWPSPRIVRVEIPQRNCGICRGTGTIEVVDFGNESASIEPCTCYRWWDPTPVVRLPRFVDRLIRGRHRAFSDSAPF